MKNTLSNLETDFFCGTPGWLGQLNVCLLVLAQIMISWFVRLSPDLGPVMTVWSLLGIPSFPLSLCPSPAFCLSLSKINS